jgi:hypothetical protein
MGEFYFFGVGKWEIGNGNMGKRISDLVIVNK